MTLIADIEPYSPTSTGTAEGFDFIRQPVGPRGTSGGNLAEEYFLIDNAYWGPLQNAIAIANKLQGGHLRERAIMLIAALHTALLPDTFGFDASNVSPLCAGLADDGSLLLEWILPNFRIGFGVEDDDSQSSWFLITDENLGNLSGAGYIPWGDPEKLVTLIWQLTSFLVLHS